MSLQRGPKIVTEGLVFYVDAANPRSYPKTGTIWSDISKTGNNGTLVNGPTFDSANGGSIVFDGVNDYVNCGDIEMDGLTGLTVEAWCKSNIIDSNSRRIVSKDQRGVQGAFILWVANDDLRWQTHDGLSFKTANYSSYSEDTNWHHVVGTLRDGTNTLYLDSVAVASIGGVGALDDADNEEIVIGADSDTASPELIWNGQIANVKIYNRGLSPSEVLHNYNALKGRFGL